MFTDPWFYGTVAGFGCFAYTLGHNITTGAAFKAAAKQEVATMAARLKALEDRWNNNNPGNKV